MAIFLSTAAIFLALLALYSRHPRTLTLDRLELRGGPDVTRIEPGRIEIERGKSYLSLSLDDSGVSILGDAAATNFALHAGGEVVSFVLTNGAEIVSVMHNGVDVRDAKHKTVLVPNGTVEAVSPDAFSGTGDDEIT